MTRPEEMLGVRLSGLSLGDAPSARGFSPLPLFRLVQRGVARYIGLRAVSSGADIRGHRQVVRHQLHELTLAGSSPVARSRNLTSLVPSPVPGLLLARAGARTRWGREAEQSARALCQRACEGAKRPELRMPKADASPVARPRNLTSLVPSPVPGSLLMGGGASS